MFPQTAYAVTCTCRHVHYRVHEYLYEENLLTCCYSQKNKPIGSPAIYSKGTSSVQHNNRRTVGSSAVLWLDARHFNQGQFPVATSRNAHPDLKTGPLPIYFPRFTADDAVNIVNHTQTSVTYLRLQALRVVSDCRQSNCRLLQLAAQAISGKPALFTLDAVHLIARC